VQALSLSPDRLVLSGVVSRESYGVERVREVDLQVSGIVGMYIL
jgi:hypothetical protein